MAKFMVSKERAKKLHATMKQALEFHYALEKRLNADETGPKMGDVFMMKDNSVYSPPVWVDPYEPEVTCEVDTCWMVLVDHPDDEELLYVVPFDSFGPNRMGPYDVEIVNKDEYGDAGVIRIACGTWVRKNTLGRIAKRIMYVSPKSLNASQQAMVALVRGDKVLRPDDADYDRENREEECRGMADKLGAYDYRMRSN